MEESTVEDATVTTSTLAMCASIKMSAGLTRIVDLTAAASTLMPLPTQGRNAFARWAGLEKDA